MVGIHQMILGSASADTTVLVSFVLVGGGGAGADRAIPGFPGGGGAGGVVKATDIVLDLGTSYTFTMGSGGAIVGGSSGATGGSGGDSIFAGYTAKGGGGGGNNGLPGDGGSGGGGYFGANGVTTQDTYSGDANATGYGNDGGAATSSSPPYYGGGGGGAGEAGNTDGLGYGGDGITDAILTNAQTGELIGGNYYVAGGGAGGRYDTLTALPGGDGGGGYGARQNADAGSGAANTGGGGGGGERDTVATTRYPGAGGSGVMALKIPDSKSVSGTATATLIANTGGFKYYRVTVGGTITVS